MAGEFEVGDWVSDFSLPSAAGKTVKLSDTVGVPVVVVFLGHDTPAAQAACDGFAAEFEQFKSLRTPILAVRQGGAVGTDLLGGGETPQGATVDWPGVGELPFPVLSDTDGSIAAKYSAKGLRAALIHPNARIFRYYEPSDNGSLAAKVLADVKSIVDLEPPRQILQQAPILLIPEVLPPEFCKKLIQTWETEGNQDSGFMVDKEGKTVGQYDYSSKIRRDHFIDNKTPLHAEARNWIVRRIVREVHKAFSFEATRLEDMKIACYDAARGGYFRPHRDNTTGATAHRRFAVSMLLNDEYEGGYLRFPEYGPHTYRPPAGGAVVFGCSLLHEATDVTAGRRFVLLTFLYGEKEAKVREDYAKRSGTGYRA
jgi:peroxiredoxin/predicted 2-oxoglutarate/Fe(II)-dependent dioxygenase YbiX